MNEAQFAFGLGTHVQIAVSNEKGMVIGRAEFLRSEDSYQVRYQASDGRAVEQWWGESSLVAIMPPKAGD